MCNLLYAGEEAEVPAFMQATRRQKNFMQFIMRKRLYGSSRLTCYLLGKNDDLLELYQILLEVDL